MFNKKVLFVIGAGASAEVKMPLGSQLKNKIREALEIPEDYLRTGVFRSPLQQAISEKCGHQMTGQRPYVEAAKALKEALLLTDSIDDTLNIWKNNEYAIFCGKVCIVNIIAAEESNSWLMPDSKNEVDLERLRNTWYYQLFSLLKTDYDKLEKLFDNVSVIDFNYDRCLQQYLSIALSKLYPDHKAHDQILSRLKIVKPYGSLGSLTDRHSAPFGKVVVTDISTYSNIKTYSEQVEDAEVLNGIVECIDRAEHIVFLGFAFHEQNLKLLGTANDKSIAAGKQTFASVLGMPHPELSVKGSWLTHYTGLMQGSAFANVDANTMMSSYKLSIAG